MIKNIIFAATILLSAGASAQTQKTKQGTTSAAKNDVKFLEDISVDIPAQPSNPKAVFSEPVFTTKRSPETSPAAASPAISIENASGIQFKYSLLLDIEVEQVRNLELFGLIDEWFGTRYRLGGTTKDGIDCSALMQTFFSGLYGVSLPRTAREQYNFSRRISRTELREGDLVFFNTIGGISHVGMYLQNNKFIHASSGGVTISDMYEDYWMKRLVGVGRVDDAKPLTASVSNP
ncbi:MAG TPA: C40 family peptidase [Flavisolibacter sp.]|nr:C40 family peptidase [Flavisolibacter sp.]